MNNLIKITDVSSKYDITARTLRYYEEMGLLSSTRSDDYSYRMYDDKAVRRLEQILILRKLNISIKDIQRVFNTSGSEVVLEVLGKKVQKIDDEVALLYELKEVVLDFIHEIEQVNFAKNSDIQLLYNKAKEIETHLVSVDYIGKPSNVNRLIKITEKLDKKIPDIMVVSIPEFKAVTCGDQPWDEMFKVGGYMYQLWQYIHLYKSIIFDCFDFLLFKNDKAEWICAVKDGVTKADIHPFKLIDFPGGLYAMAVSIDEDNESIRKVEDKVRQWIETTNFELDKDRNVMFNMPYIYEDGRNIAYKDIEKGLGYKQMQRYFPIKLKDDINSFGNELTFSFTLKKIIILEELKMSKYDNAIKLMEERCGNEKEVVIALATISLSMNATDNPRPVVRMVCAYYEDGVFYVSTDARKNKSLQIEKNNEVAICGLGDYAFQGIAENLGWVKDEKNAKIRAKFKKIFDWFDEVGDENNPNSIVLRITLTEGTIIDNEKKYDEQKYEIDFINKVVK